MQPVNTSLFSVALMKEVGAKAYSKATLFARPYLDRAMQEYVLRNQQFAKAVFGSRLLKHHPIGATAGLLIICALFYQHLIAKHRALQAKIDGLIESKKHSSPGAGAASGSSDRDFAAINRCLDILEQDCEKSKQFLKERRMGEKRLVSNLIDSRIP